MQALVNGKSLKFGVVATNIFEELKRSGFLHTIMDRPCQIIFDRILKSFDQLFTS